MCTEICPYTFITKEVYYQQNQEQMPTLKLLEEGFFFFQIKIELQFHLF